MSRGAPFFAVLVGLQMALGACTRAPLVDPSQAMRPKAGVAIEDDMAYAELAAPLREQVAVLRKSGKSLRFGAKSIDAAAYAEKLEALILALDAGKGAEHLRAHFDTYEVYGGERWGEVKLTAYYEPIIQGAREATAQYSEPVMRRPDDLLAIATNQYWEPIKGVSSMRGRLDPKQKTRIIPYFTRDEIYKGALKERQLELAWVDPVDGFFMQIQGSGTIALDDGASLRVGYADQNGHPYKAIGSLLLDAIPKAKMSMDAIVAHLRGLDLAKRMELMAANPSYVFFDVRQGPAVTSNTTAAIPGRTIATDTKFFPKGAIALLQFDGKTRVVIDQDAGGAIRGGGRVDLFWGRGAEAGKIAGAINQKATLHYLVPR